MDMVIRVKSVGDYRIPFFKVIWVGLMVIHIAWLWIPNLPSDLSFVDIDAACSFLLNLKLTER